MLVVAHSKQPHRRVIGLRLNTRAHREDGPVFLAPPLERGHPARYLFPDGWLVPTPSLDSAISQSDQPELIFTAGETPAHRPGDWLMPRIPRKNGA